MKTKSGAKVLSRRRAKGRKRVSVKPGFREKSPPRIAKTVISLTIVQDCEVVSADALAGANSNPRRRRNRFSPHSPLAEAL